MYDLPKPKCPFIIDRTELKKANDYPDEYIEKFEKENEMTPEERKQLLKMIENGEVIGGVKDDGTLWVLP